MSSSFRRGVNDVPVLLGCYAASIGIVANVSGHRVSPILLDRLNFDDRTERLFRNVGNYQLLATSQKSKDLIFVCTVPASM